nr:extended synaptotagmin-3 [Tanacetum cinerariifolium]
MDELGTEKSNYIKMHETSPHRASEDLWKTYGTSISMGFLATAVFVSLFIIMAIIEHFFRPNVLYQASHRPGEPRPVHKLVDPPPHEQVGNASDFSVLMPGQKYPTYIAHPTPLACSREGVRWPSHHQQICVHP